MPSGVMKPGGGGGSGGGGGAPFQTNEAGTLIIPLDNGQSLVIGSDRMDRDTADVAKNIRAFFNKVKGAFRAGEANGSQWDDANVGAHSFASGYNNLASGANSHAEGNGTSSQGNASHSEGTGTRASGESAHAEGKNTQATQPRAHAEGDSTQATSVAAHAEGGNCRATNYYTHAEGTYSEAFAYASHAEGWRTETSGQYSHAEGASARTTRMAEFAKASGQFSAKGDAQMGNLVLMRQTTDATPTILTSQNGVPRAANSNAPNDSNVNVLTVLAKRAMQLKVSVVARRTDVQGEMAGWSWEGLVGRDATGDARIIGAPVVAAWGDAPATDAWDLAVSIDVTDATNNYVAVTATGEAGKTIRWVAKLEWVEVGG